MEQTLDVSKADSMYLLPEILPYLCCFACLMVVIENSEKSRKLYEGIKKCMELPGFKDFLDMLKKTIPEREKLAKKVIDASEVKPNPDAKEFDLSNTQKLMDGLSKVIADYTGKSKLWLLFRRNKLKDFEELIEKVSVFVQEGFNRESDKAKGIYKITAFTSPTLAITICGYGLAEVKGINLLGLTNIHAYKIGKKTYTIGDLIVNKTSRRKFYKLKDEYENAGFKLKHVIPIAEKAILWYKCRVKYQGVSDFCKQMSLKGNDYYDPATISHQIKEIDDALNYSRDS